MQEMDRMKQAKRSLYNCTLRKKISLKEKFCVWSKEEWTKRTPLEWHRSSVFSKNSRILEGLHCSMIRALTCQLCGCSSPLRRTVHCRAATTTMHRLCPAEQLQSKLVKVVMYFSKILCMFNEQGTWNVEKHKKLQFLLVLFVFVHVTN